MCDVSLDVSVVNQVCQNTLFRVHGKRSQDWREHTEYLDWESRSYLKLVLIHIDIEHFQSCLQMRQHEHVRLVSWL